MYAPHLCLFSPDRVLSISFLLVHFKISSMRVAALPADTIPYSFRLLEARGRVSDRMGWITDQKQFLTAIEVMHLHSQGKLLLSDEMVRILALAMERINFEYGPAMTAVMRGYTNLRAKGHFVTFHSPPPMLQRYCYATWHIFQAFNRPVTRKTLQTGPPDFLLFIPRADLTPDALNNISQTLQRLPDPLCPHMIGIVHGSKLTFARIYPLAVALHRMDRQIKITQFQHPDMCNGEDTD
ncbi:hypothetical protein QR46_2341 [Giardia duodenalis assemblage B]|uniref:Uncharacterized protein n=1 Tax=Giardia duodenalis assemblage B TaxID=1394984 RepID=A0A132NU79_GIAIN|nr:hypothetical protein QR46_2341 [Giardia intestinalis assemblage B]